MYKIKTNIELPIAISTTWDQESLPTLYGFNYFVTLTLETDTLDESGMVIDFKKMKKVIHNYFDQYDHSMILKEGNPLIDIYKKNFEENGIDFERSRLFVWPENPTAEYMSKYWWQEMKLRFAQEGLTISKLLIEVEETSHNSVTYEG